ncbi:hypothetical protein [Methylobacterium aquaticum]|uniref:Uncharacterized protein n=1 Tax=Methylobacterium aquaticum TaxID=270351 RepID=A0A0J6S092_9HYPH|nr:hypothetical protein [Methylobacterium aquaticum]KMO28545.1 hypothetical protein VP06_27100 [Methylobacterium aquaticum]
MGAPFRSGAVPAPSVPAALMASRHRYIKAEQRFAVLVAKVAAGHTRLSTERPSLFEIREVLEERQAARRAVDEAYYAALRTDDFWENGRRQGAPTPLDEDDIATALMERWELNYAAAIEAAEPAGEPTFRDDVRATLVAGAGYR